MRIKVHEHINPNRIFEWYHNATFEHEIQEHNGMIQELEMSQAELVFSYFSNLEYVDDETVAIVLEDGSYIFMNSEEAWIEYE